VIPDFAPGQEWSIKSSPPTQAKVVVNRVERWRDKIAVHVSIIDIAQSAVASGPIAIIRIDHIPFEISALARSVDKLLATGVPAPPNFEAGYKMWKEDKGGIYTITVTEATHIGNEPMSPRQQ
jgi:hypothetical protein